MKQGMASTATIVPVEDDTPSLPLDQASSPAEEVESKLKVAREALLSLQRQREELERQKGDLEELRRKQDEYSRGKAEMIEKLTRGSSTLEREQISAQRLAELCDKTSTAFRDYLEQLHSIDDEQWTSETLRQELSLALGTIENSRLEYNRALTRLDCLNPAAGQKVEPVAVEEEGIDWDEMMRYLRIGAAASAPLIIAGTLWLIVFLAVGAR